MSALALVLSCVGCGASQSRAYTLRLDVAKPGQIDLCRLASIRAANAKQGSADDETCETFDNQALEAPARLSVELVHAKRGASYELEVDQRYLPANGQHGSVIVGEVFKRLLGFADDFVKTVEMPNARGGDPAAETHAARSSLANAMADVVPGGAKQLLQYVTTASDVPPPAHRQEPKDLFSRWVPPEGKSFMDRRSEPLAKIFAEPAFQPPPPRIADLEAGDVTFLRAKGISSEQLAKFTTEKCAPSSFGKYAPSDADWAQVAASPPSPAEVARALLVDETAFANVLLTQRLKLNLSERITQLLERAKTNLPKRPDRDAEVIFQAAQLALLNKQAEHCQRNLEFVSALHPQGDYGAAKAQVAWLLSTTKPTATLFREAVQPYMVRAARNYLSAIGKEDRIAFAAVTVRTGSVALTAHQDDGRVRSKVAELTVQAKAHDPIALVIGAFGSVCDACFSSVEESVSPATGTAPAGRVLREVTESERLGAAIGAQITIFRHASSHVGVSAGYPIVGGADRAEQVLLGIGYRNTLGFSVAVGAHVFRRAVLRDDLAGEVDLGAPGNVSLNAEDVSEFELSGAFFALLGISSDLFVAQ